MKEKAVIYWSRRDFRLSDNPALFAAVAHAKKEQMHFLPIFILEDYMVAGSPAMQFGYPSRVFLARALPRFAAHFENFTVVCGKAAKSIIALSQQFDVTVFVNEDVYADFYIQLKKIRDAGVDIKLYEDALSVSKETKTGAGNIYSIFTPFKNAVWKEFCTKKVLPKARIADAPAFTKNIGKICKTIDCNEKDLQKAFSTSRQFSAGGTTYDIDTMLDMKPAYADGYSDEAGAYAHFDHFLKNGMSEYKDKRDSLDIDGTSKMSLALAWGLVSARVLREKMQKHYDTDFLSLSTNPKIENATHYISELIWREFYKYLLYHYPQLMHAEFQEKFRNKVRWADQKIAHHRFTKWIQGETGYPIVDAAMMELAQTGLMHNRSRMIVASVLTKNLGVDWRWGQEYFRAMLLDLDEASNNGGWQWGASVGADPKPIRIFNPYLQADNYDKEKIYQKKYLRKDYFENPPALVVEHKDARDEALARYGLGGIKKESVRDY